jgi:seryl-tRNA synthetase
MCELHGGGTFTQGVFDAGLLRRSGVAGILARSGTFEGVIEAFEAFVTRHGVDQQAEVLRFPPLFPRADYGKVNHIHNFPDLLGSVHSFEGSEREARRMARDFDEGQDWTAHLAPSETMLIPAACYPLYPLLTGPLPASTCIDLRSWVFRHEPSEDLPRMQCFRQREYVRVGTADEAWAHRELWRERALEMLRSLGLPAVSQVANDPFFGRGGRLAKATQREQDLKYEVVVPITSEDRPTAVSSQNCHLEAFGVGFGIQLGDGSPAHTACVGFGLERIALALFKTHGLRVQDWPASVRAELGL